MSDMEKNIETVCAVVVTYNRKNLLLECLEALRKQTRPIQGIYLIDNASTDGTPELLLEKGYIKELPPKDLKEPWEKEFEMNNLTNGESIKIHYVRMHENTGGAGGFYEGVKRGYEKGYDWLWLMDDDAEPQINTLERLFEVNRKLLGKHHNVLCPLILAEEGRIQNYHHKKVNRWLGTETPAILFTKLEDLSKFTLQEHILELDANAFVGPLIHRNVVEKAGYPKKELFIWGDDLEYTFRIKQKGFGLKLVLNAFILHKDGGYAFAKKLPREQYWKVYYSMRNRIFMIKNYFSPLSLFYWTARILFSFLKHRDPELYKIKLKGLKDGLFF